MLVLGGSTFMGRELVQRLVGRPARVCIVNRGRKYWGTDDTSGGRAARLVADRREADAFAAMLDEATKRLGTRWALVADFSAYNGADIRASLAGLRGRFDTYAYISSDSVYEVSAWAGNGWLPQAGCEGEPRVAEAASERPSDQAAQRRLRRADGYGDGKLEAEEALAAGLAECAGCRGVSLRLPDVIGPFDDTLRLWAYWHWLHAGPEDPPQVPDSRAAKRPRRSSQDGGCEGRQGAQDAAEEDAVPLAFVFSQDVARFIAGLLDAPAIPDMPAHDAVNLACEQQLHLRGFLGLLASAAGLASPPRVAVVEKPKTFLPSVERPWLLSCKRLLEVYSFKPTPLPDVLKCCADWFAKACEEFPAEARRAAGKLPARARKAAIERARLTEVPSSSSSSASEESSDK